MESKKNDDVVVVMIDERSDPPCFMSDGSWQYWTQPDQARPDGVLFYEGGHPIFGEMSYE